MFKRLYAWIILTLKNPVVKKAINKIHDEFAISELGKSIVQQAKEKLLKGEEKEKIILEILDTIKDKIHDIVKDPKLQTIVFDYLKNKVAALLK